MNQHSTLAIDAHRNKFLFSLGIRMENYTGQMLSERFATNKSQMHKKLARGRTLITGRPFGYVAINQSRNASIMLSNAHTVRSLRDKQSKF